MIGVAVNLALFAADQTVQSAKTVHGFAKDRTQEIHGFAVDRALDVHGFVQNVHGFAVDRAQETMGTLQNAAETAKSCTIESVKGVHDFAHGTAQAMLRTCGRATSTAKRWVARVIAASKHYWKANSSEKGPHQAHPQEKDLYVGFSGAALMAMAMPSEDMERIMHRSSNKVFFAKDIGTYSDGKEVQELSPKG